MSKIAILLLVLVLSCRQAQSPASIVRYENVESTFVQSRPVDVWLPPGYQQGMNFPVLYMHDGQMLFDSTTTWNKQEWGVDEVMTKLISEGTIPPTIVVAIHNIDSLRHNNYFPQKPFESLPPSVQDSLYAFERSPGKGLFGSKVDSDNYLRFIVQELKPFVDSQFKTATDRSSTFIMGSSMGGLISMYALCEYPDVFGGAACLSTHWPGMFSVDNNPIPQAFYEYMSENLPNPVTNKIYFDYGTATLDALYEPCQIKVDSIMRVKGFSDKNWITRKFEGHAHDERSWRNRLHLPVTFLLNNNQE